MPALPNVPNVIRVDMRFLTAPGLQAGVRFFLKYSGGPPVGSDLVTLATDISGQFGTHLASMLFNSNDLGEVICTDLASSSGARGIWTGTVAGTRSGAQVPLGTSAQIDYTIARRYRGGKPKQFGPYGTSTDLSEVPNTWTPAFVSALTTAWDAFAAAITAITAGSITITAQVNVSYYSGFTVVTNPVTHRARNVPTLRSGGPLVDTITGYAVRAEIAAQRRRRTSLS